MKKVYILTMYGPERDRSMILGVYAKTSSAFKARDRLREYFPKNLIIVVEYEVK